MTHDRAHEGVVSRDRRTEQLEYRLILALTFPVFLAVAATRSILRIGRPASGPRRSLIEEARTAANTTIPFAFMA